MAFVPNTLKGFGVTLDTGETMFPPWTPFFLPRHRTPLFGSRRAKPGSAGERLAPCQPAEPSNGS
jgi:hypothetical protein